MLPRETGRQVAYILNLDRKFFERNPGREFHIRRPIMEEAAHGDFTLVWQPKPGIRIRHPFFVHGPLRAPIDTEECGRQWFEYLLATNAVFAGTVRQIRSVLA